MNIQRFAAKPPSWGRALSERRLNLEGLPPDKAIRRLIEASFDHLAANPDFIVLLNDENRGGARHVRGSTRLEAMHSPLVKSVSHILHEGVRCGLFRKGIDPVQLYISIAGLSYFFFSNTPTLSAIFGKDLSSRAQRRARRRQRDGAPEHRTQHRARDGHRHGHDDAERAFEGK